MAAALLSDGASNAIPLRVSAPFHGAARSAAEFRSADGIGEWVRASLARFDT